MKFRLRDTLESQMREAAIFGPISCAEMKTKKDMLTNPRSHNKVIADFQEDCFWPGFFSQPCSSRPQGT